MARQEKLAMRRSVVIRSRLDEPATKAKSFFSPLSCDKNAPGPAQRRMRTERGVVA
jgi:hypothetical protein